MILGIIGLLVIAVPSVLFKYKATKQGDQPQQAANSNLGLTNVATKVVTIIPTLVTTPGWKIFENDKIRISYPSDWKLDSNRSGSAMVSFVSSDFTMNPLSGFIKTGYLVSLYYNRTQWDGSLGLQWTKTVQWLGQSGTLQKYQFDSNDIVLTATISGVKMQMVLSAAPQLMPETYSNVLFKVANNISLK